MKTSNQEMHPLYSVAVDDAVGMLIADHKRVASLFADFKRLTDEGRDEEKASVVKKICKELTVHTQLEEELFYPAVRKATGDEDQVDEALVEHAGAKQLIAQLQRADPSEDLYDAKVTVLAEQIDHHVEEEEGSMFPKARYAGLDTLKLGAAMQARKAELLSGASGRAAPMRTPSEFEVDADGEESDIEQRTKGSRPKATKKQLKKKPSVATKKSRRR
jgi:hemerythrin superfamily protein